MTADALLGIDIGTSFVKVSLLDVSSGEEIAHASAPETELAISSPQPGWAEQDPNAWWNALAAAMRALRKTHAAQLQEVRAVGITYQMHGLVVLDDAGTVLRPAIIWCDSRAVKIGEAGARKLGDAYCREHVLNSPGNFTASKLKWVFENEPDVASRIATAFLPGDYIAFRLSGECNTTATGLSEMILWDFQLDQPAASVLDTFGLTKSNFPPIVYTFGEQCRVRVDVAETLGIPANTPVSYRAGDQPNNAYSLNVLEPGEVAATAGTSGVIYGVSDKAKSDDQFRVNSFLHVTSTSETPRLGVLLCVNGTGISYGWMRKFSALNTTSYDDLNVLAAKAPLGSDGLTFLPFGNGVERMLTNRNCGAQLSKIDFNRHGQTHLLRAVQEGIACAFNYGLSIMLGVGVKKGVVRAGASNLFKSPVFCQAFAGLTGCEVELLQTDGAQGAARGAGVGSGLYASHKEALSGLRIVQRVAPSDAAQWSETYERWQTHLETVLSGN